MQKPKKEAVIVAYRYDECHKYIEHLLGDVELRDFAGKFGKSKPLWEVDATPYQNWWHLVIDMHPEISNGSLIFMHVDHYDEFIKENPEWKWSKPIAAKFFEEFGLEFECWVEW